MIKNALQKINAKMVIRHAGGRELAVAKLNVAIFELSPQFENKTPDEIQHVIEHLAHFLTIKYDTENKTFALRFTDKTPKLLKKYNKNKKFIEFKTATAAADFMLHDALRALLPATSELSIDEQTLVLFLLIPYIEVSIAFDGSVLDNSGENPLTYFITFACLD